MCLQEHTGLQTHTLGEARATLCSFPNGLEQVMKSLGQAPVRQGNHTQPLLCPLLSPLSLCSSVQTASLLGLIFLISLRTRLIVSTSRGSFVQCWVLSPQPSTFSATAHPWGHISSPFQILERSKENVDRSKNERVLRHLSCFKLSKNHFKKMGLRSVCLV